VSDAALLDVNVLIALFDPGHVHHEPAHDWFADNAARGWATCPVTEAGFIRVLSALGSPTLRPATLVDHLRRFCASGAHEFWPGTISLTDTAVFDLTFASGRNLTDIYLFGLANARGGRLATFDRTIPVKAVVGARRGVLEVIAPAS
jgi:toxin-antitoxin system PIN domain toxin